ncbi:MAG TPA: glycosyltransferase family 4 protein, partial [Longimicrobiales bacterium]|nr:glycosyltransferase family 4 protein [Longimicrobiales bacterium]
VHRATDQFTRWAPQVLLDVPNERSSHERPTLRGGGLAIVLAVVVGAALYAVLSGHWTEFAPYFLGAVLVAGVSLIDDVRSLPFAVRLAVHVAAAVLAIMAYTLGRGLPLPPLPSFVTAGATLLWIVGLTNAYNFMDGIDGLAGTQAVIAAGAWIILGLVLGVPEVALLAALVAGAAGGFLLHNWPPARIFMGDVGSAFLGYTFAVLPLMAWGTARLGVAALCIVGVFVFDTAFTFLRRISRGENVLQAHRSHLYQRLVVAGSSHGAVTSLYATLAAMLAAAGIAVALTPPYWLLLATMLTVGATAGLWLHVRRQERGTEAAASGTTESGGT